MQVGLKTSRELETKLPMLSFIPYQNHSFSSTSASYPDLFDACEDNRKEFQNFQPNIRNLQAKKISHYHSKILPGEGLFKQRATWVGLIPPPKKKIAREKTGHLLRTTQIRTAGIQKHQEG